MQCLTVLSTTPATCQVVRPPTAHVWLGVARHMRQGVSHTVRLAVGQHNETRLEPDHATRAQRLELPS